MTDFLRSETSATHPTLSELFFVFGRVGLLSFGGPAGQIGMMHRVLVDEKRWLSEERFLHALNYCMLLPGPEAQQLATYAGWLLHGRRGGIIAGTLFVLPGFLVIVALAAAYALYQDTHWLPALLFGLKAGVLAIVIEALLRVAKRALKSRFLIGVAVAAFIALFFFGVPFPLVILAAGISGFLKARGARSTKPDVESKAPHLLRQIRGVFVGILIWQMPLLLFWLLAAPRSLIELQEFFSRLAVVTFGGAYAVLAYVAQVAVETHHWMTASEMLDGLALAEATPGPLVLVLSYIGFPRSVSASGHARSDAGWCSGGECCRLGDFRPKLYLHISRCALCGKAERQCGSIRRLVRHYRRGGGRHSQSFGLVWSACSFWQSRQG